MSSKSSMVADCEILAMLIKHQPDNLFFQDSLTDQEIDAQQLLAMADDVTEWVETGGPAGLGVSLISLHTIGLEWRHGLIAAPAVEGLPLMRRWHVVNTAGKLLSPAAEALRYFVLERGEAHLAAMFSQRADMA